MKRLSVVLFLLLAGCSAEQQANTQDKIQQVIDYTVSLCGFLPDPAAVAAMLGAPNPTVTGVLGIATAICNVAGELSGPRQAERDGKCPEVNGVCVKGKFVETHMLKRPSE